MNKLFQITAMLIVSPLIILAGLVGIALAFPVAALFGLALNDEDWLENAWEQATILPGEFLKIAFSGD